jgi:DNA-binding LytR/AlgR family response regulator
VQPDLIVVAVGSPDLCGRPLIRRCAEAESPLVAFVSVLRELAVDAFDLNAVDFLVPPVRPERMRIAIQRAYARLGRTDRSGSSLPTAFGQRAAAEAGYLERLPIRRATDVVIVPVSEVVSIVARGERLHITTVSDECFTIAHRLHDLARRLDPKRFVRLNRATLANLSLIRRIQPASAGTYTAFLSSGRELPVSRIQARLLRPILLQI